MKNPLKVFYLLWPPWYKQKITALMLNRGLYTSKQEEKIIKQEEENEKPPKPSDYRFYPERNCVLITTEGSINLHPAKYKDDHTIEFKNIDGKKKKIEIRPIDKGTVKDKDKEGKEIEKPIAKAQAHILTLPLRRLMPTKMLALLAPKVQRYRVYTVQAEGEITHDPNDDKLDEYDKMRLESLLKIKGTATKADIVSRIMAGLKEKLGFWAYFRDVLYIVVIVLLILSYQVFPNL